MADRPRVHVTIGRVVVRAPGRAGRAKLSHVLRREVAAAITQLPPGRVGDRQALGAALTRSLQRGVGSLFKKGGPP